MDPEPDLDLDPLSRKLICGSGTLLREVEMDRRIGVSEDGLRGVLLEWWIWRIGGSVEWWISNGGSVDGADTQWLICGLARRGGGMGTALEREGGGIEGGNENCAQKVLIYIPNQ